MPNQRKKGLKFIGAWLPTKLHAEIKRIARQRGCSASTIIDELLTAHVNAGGDPQRLADAAMSSEISKVVAIPEAASTNYGSKRKAARRSKAQPADDSELKGL